MNHALKFVIIVVVVPIIVAVLNLAARPITIRLDGQIQQIDITYGHGSMGLPAHRAQYIITCQAKTCAATGQKTQFSSMSRSIEMSQTIPSHNIPFELINTLKGALVNLQPISDRHLNPEGVRCFGATDNSTYSSVNITTDMLQTIFMESDCDAEKATLWKVRINEQWYNQISGEIPAAYMSLLWAAQAQ